MNNTGKKILILGIVIAIVLSGIFAFYPTIVAPPTEVPINNLHKVSLETDISRFSDTRKEAFNDSLYRTIVDKLEIYKKEKFMTDGEIDYQTKALIQKYLPVFVKQSNAKFEVSVWNDVDHEVMLNRIAQLRALKVGGGKTRAILTAYNSDLHKIEQIVEQYRKAKEVATYSIFYSVNDANKKIQSAEYYKKMYPLSNCMKLVNKLSAVKREIGNSHYYLIAFKVDALSRFRDMSEESFYTLAYAINTDIQEYDNNRSNYGIGAKTTEKLKKDAANLYRDAVAFYTREEININTNNEWTSMSSPHTAYRAYQSYSNYHKPNVDATMSFTIRGYESFTFYIRSNGETEYDYVMVGLDQMPTIVSNYTSTKGNSQSGTTFYNYKRVTINNLTKRNKYTIYVVYHKDGVADIGADRGYVLIPYK